ncbi:MAG: arsenic metallochaperone ArsD family protein [Candidatus Helarchaeota archaeon]|nr:arsenic metallochaperone ArsD family protein [Candidatus Helarchaeota archaeon]
MPDLYIFEMDPTGGYCGFPAEIPGLPPADVMRQELIRRNKVIKQLQSQLKIEVKRIFLKTVSFLKNEIVKAFVRQEGNNAFPVFLYGEKILHSGSFPSFEEIAQKLNAIKK